MSINTNITFDMCLAPLAMQKTNTKNQYVDQEEQPRASTNKQHQAPKEPYGINNNKDGDEQQNI